MAQSKQAQCFPPISMQKLLLVILREELLLTKGELIKPVGQRKHSRSTAMTSSFGLTRPLGNLLNTSSKMTPAKAMLQYMTDQVEYVT